MRIHLIGVGTKMPDWVESGYAEYAKRLPHECSLNLIEIAASPRGKNADLKRAIQAEGERMLKAIPKNSLVVALDVKGKSHSTESLAQELEGWLSGGRDVSLLVGGPEGLSSACRAEAQKKWSLSKLTFPHPLVRVIIAEQVYRAWSYLNGHPYHRA